MNKIPPTILMTKSPEHGETYVARNKNDSTSYTNRGWCATYNVNEAFIFTCKDLIEDAESVASSSFYRESIPEFQECIRELEKI